MSECWQTPGWLFRQLDDEFGFGLDAAANAMNCKVPVFIDARSDGLGVNWQGFGPVWLNPPYNRNIGRWAKKAYDESRRGVTVVCLLPASTDTNWWYEWVSRADEVRFIHGRLYFTDEHGRSGRAPFGSAVVIFRPGRSRHLISYFGEVL